MMTTMERYRPFLMVVTFGLLGLAFFLAYRPRRAAAEKRPSRMLLMNKIVLWTVTVVVAFFLFCPQYVTRLVSTDEGFTADMNRTVLAVEGMMCPG